MVYVLNIRFRGGRLHKETITKQFLFDLPRKKGFLLQLFMMFPLKWTHEANGLPGQQTTEIVTVRWWWWNLCPRSNSDLNGQMCFSFTHKYICVEVYLGIHIYIYWRRTRRVRDGFFILSSIMFVYCKSCCSCCQKASLCRSCFCWQSMVITSQGMSLALGGEGGEWIHCSHSFVYRSGHDDHEGMSGCSSGWMYFISIDLDSDFYWQREF